MSLASYNKKRNFSETPEPVGKGKPSGKRLRFVVQKHDASSLHYDFRLEWDGVLKSWAVPKGPSLNPADKRLAMAVEDHPYDYRTFEGVIPEGNYGGGVVIVWDEGFYEPVVEESGKSLDKEATLAEGYKAGSLKFVLHGKKLNGIFSLRKFGKAPKTWLLIKSNDAFASKEDITLQNQSVKSGNTIAEVAAAAGITPNHPEAESIKKAAAKNGVAKKAPAKKRVSEKSTAPLKELPLKVVERGKKLLVSGGTDHAVLINRRELRLTSLDKIYWPEEGVRKIDVVNYYHQIAPYILPYMKGRPQSLHRHPSGIAGQHFFQKDMKGKLPEWIPMHRDFSESTGKDVDYLVCNDEATLVYMANLGCIEMHPWHSLSRRWQKPDWCLIDLDPEGIGFDKVIQCAQVVKSVLDAIGADSYVKTSGSTGIHIYIPLGAKYDFEQSKNLAELVVRKVNKEIPGYTSIERNPSKRKGKIYLDYLQNRETQTAAAPYSLRPKPGVPVSTPLHWTEVKSGLTSTTYNMKNIFTRLKREGDIFKPVLGRGISLPKVLKRLEGLF